MTIEETIKYFGNLNRVCTALDIAPQNMTKWKKNGYIPMLQQYRIAKLTNDVLVPDETDPSKIKVIKERHIGYKRVSSKDQNTSIQLNGIALDCIYQDFVMGATKERPQLKACLDTLREGDTLYINSVDRISRSVGDLVAVVERVVGVGAKIQLVEEGLSLSGHKDEMFSTCMIQVLGVFAQLERAMRKERQREGIEQAKKNGTRSGRPFGNQPLDMTRRDEAIEYSKSGMNISQIARAMKLSRASIYKLIE